MKFAELKKHISLGRFFPAYLITGEDDFLLQLASKQFKGIVKNMPELDLSVFTEKTDIVAIVEALNSLPFLNDKKIVLCNELEGDATVLEKYLASPNPQTILIVVSKKLPDILKKIIPQFTIVDCNKLEQEHIARWVAMQLKETNSSIQNNALNLLVEYCSGSLTRIDTEIKKLSFYRANEIITKDCVLEMVEPNLDFQIFELSDAVANKQVDRVSKVLTKFFDENAAPIMLLGVLYSHFRRLLYCSINANDTELAKKFGVKDFAITKANQAAKVIGARRLKSICDNFAIIDLKIKTSEYSDKLGLMAFILEILTK